MLDNVDTNRRLWLVTAAIALGASVAGLLDPTMYDRVVTDRILPGVIAQDAFTALFALVALAIAWRTRSGETKKQIVVLGLMGYLFYANGVYVIEQVYTVAYFAYMAVFGLSAYAIVYALMCVRRANLQGAILPRHTRLASLLALLGTPAVFYPLWMSRILPLIEAGRRLEFLYSVYVLDLCFVMPAFLIVAWRTYDWDVLGAAFAPTMFVLGFAVLVPLPVGELLRPALVGQPIDASSLWLFLGLSAVYLVLAARTLWALDPGGGRRLGVAG